MTQAMVTIIAPLALERIREARIALEQLGNPAVEPVRAAMAEAGLVHFASLHAIAGSDGRCGYLVLEFSADGEADALIDEIAARMAPFFTPVFALCETWQPTTTLARFWRQHRVAVGYGVFDTPGLCFSGTPGHSVKDIEREAALFKAVTDVLSRQTARLSPLARLHDVREQLGETTTWRRLLDPPPPPLAAPAEELGLLALAWELAPSFIATFLWPLLLLVVPLSFWLALPLHGLERDAGAITQYIIRAIGLIFLALLVSFIGTYFSLRRKETNDWVSDRAPDAAALKEMLVRENAPGYFQNHMISHTVIKPGVLRRHTLRFAFWAVAKISALNPRPGFLNDIGTIHFARWVTIPGTRDLLFLSNYGGSWESYLEDFITKAHDGLTAVWSNTVGFPRAVRLFQQGATDGERFKRYARQSMRHTPFWYCAYPQLTTSNIRANALVRRGLAAAMTEDEAMHWLSLFGSACRPVEKLETSQIQSIVFGGLGFKSEGRLVTIALSPRVDDNRRWLGKVLPYVSFNDGRYIEKIAVLTIAASAEGLHRFGLPQSALATFPGAFTSTMTGPGRDRILGDVADNAIEHWWWGQSGAEVALLIYGNSANDVDQLEDVVQLHCQSFGCPITHRINLAPVGQSVADRREPFGFVDGVSQPAIRGTYRGLRNDDPIHLVEPGEFILGYPDNRGNVPPGPLLDAQYDPGLVLPVAGVDHGFGQAMAGNPRLVGYNGSFLVIRQLEQDVEGFAAYCEGEAHRLNAHFRDPAICDAEFIGAKMIGRWKDGSSLARHPYMSATRLAALNAQNQLPASQVDKSVARPQSNPSSADAMPIANSHRAPTTIVNQIGSTVIRPDNDFLFGTEDPQGLRCPYGAHVRRANPRDSMKPGSNEQIDIANRHRILRIGRMYQPNKGQKPGLLFMCLNGDIERQFEFIQQTWIGSVQFHGLNGEADPIAGNGRAGHNGFTIPTRDGPVMLTPQSQFVRMRGGGYFFLPGRQLLRFLAN